MTGTRLAATTVYHRVMLLMVRVADSPVVPGHDAVVPWM
jgi:hypothetical protein